MKENLAIAIIAPVKPEDYTDLLWQGIVAASVDLASLGVQVQSLTTGDDADVAGQRGILSSLTERSVDAVGIFPAHATALNDLIDGFEARGVPVVTIYADAPESRRSAFVGTNAFHAGILAAEVLSKQMRGGRVLSFPGPAGRAHLAQRYQGFREELARQPGAFHENQCSLTVDALETSENLREVLSAADGYYVGNGDLARIAALLEKVGIRAPCIGFGITERVGRLLSRGAVWAVIDDSRYQVGYFAVQKAYEAILKREHGDKLTGVQIPTRVTYAGNASQETDSLNSAFEMLVRQRTETLIFYKERLEHANAELVSLSATDPLTGLLNRRRFGEVMQQECARALRYEPVSLLVLELNFFKQVNDSLGHQAGDDVLKAVAAVLVSSSRATDVCARLGGDEFAVILPHTDTQSAEVVRQRMLKRIAATRVPASDHTLSVSLSIGLATLPGDAESVEALIAAADADMCKAKITSHMEHPTPAPAITA